MTSAAVVFRLNESRAGMSPFVNQLSNYFTRNRGLSDQRDQDSFRFRVDSFNSTCNRCAHFAVRIGIDSELKIKIFQVLSNIVSSMAYDHDDVFDIRRTQTLEAGFDNGVCAKV